MYRILFFCSVDALILGRLKLLLKTYLVSSLHITLMQEGAVSFVSHCGKYLSNKLSGPIINYLKSTQKRSTCSNSSDLWNLTVRCCIQLSYYSRSCAWVSLVLTFGNIRPALETSCVMANTCRWWIYWKETEYLIWTRGSSMCTQYPPRCSTRENEAHQMCVRPGAPWCELLKNIIYCDVLVSIVLNRSSVQSNHTEGRSSPLRKSSMASKSVLLSHNAVIFSY